MVSAAFLHTPPFPAALTSMTADIAAALAQALASRGRVLGGVNADLPVAAAFAAAWRELTGDAVEEHMRSRLYQLGPLRPAGTVPARPGPAGRPSRPQPADRLVARRSTTRRSPATGTSLGSVDDRLSYHGYTLWEHAGQPVSLAGLTRQVAGQVRVGPVYTPPGQRGRGYGGAATWTVSQAALTPGRPRCCCSPTWPTPPATPSTSGWATEPVADRAGTGVHQERLRYRRYEVSLRALI